MGKHKNIKGREFIIIFFFFCRGIRYQDDIKRKNIISISCKGL